MVHSQTLLPVEPELVLIPAGEFLMGSNPDKDRNARDNEQPQHRLHLPDYHIARTPVTNAEYRYFIEAGGYTGRWRHCWTAEGWAWKEEKNRAEPRFWQADKFSQAAHPVVGISWYEAVAYCRWLSQQTGQSYRLPTEAEWEKAARGTGGFIYPWGDTWDPKRCNHKFSGPMSVDAFPDGASPYGVLVWQAILENGAARFGKKKHIPFKLRLSGQRNI